MSRLRPSNSVSLRASRAVFACSTVPISTNPYPFFSKTLTLITSPNLENNVFSCPSLTEYVRLPTNNFRLFITRSKNCLTTPVCQGDRTKGETVFLLDHLCEQNIKVYGISIKIGSFTDTSDLWEMIWIIIQKKCERDMYFFYLTIASDAGGEQ